MSELQDPCVTASGALVQRIIDTYQTLGPNNLTAVRSLYTSDVFFEDPAHGFQGIDALMAYFQSLFADVDRCEFRFHQQFAADSDIFLSWTMLLEHKRLKAGETVRVEGASHMKAREGKVYYHRDYFDLGAMVYENLPVLGRIVSLVRKRLGQ